MLPAYVRPELSREHEIVLCTAESNLQTLYIAHNFDTIARVHMGHNQYVGAGRQQFIEPLKLEGLKRPDIARQC